MKNFTGHTGKDKRGSGSGRPGDAQSLEHQPTKKQLIEQAIDSPEDYDYTDAIPFGEPEPQFAGFDHSGKGGSRDEKAMGRSPVSKTSPSDNTFEVKENFFLSENEQVESIGQNSYLSEDQREQQKSLNEVKGLIDEVSRVNIEGDSTKKKSTPSQSMTDAKVVTETKKANNKPTKKKRSSDSKAVTRTKNETQSKSMSSNKKQTTPSTEVSAKRKKGERRVLGRSNHQGFTNKIIRNRFELKRKVGAGGMGTVYKAVDQIMVEANDKNPFVAVKILRDELKKNKEAFKALQREYRKQLKLAHPNVVQVYDFDREGELIYMTMEFLQGKDLEKVLRKFRGRGIPFDKAFEVIGGICDALMHAHKNNLIHYDFKPGNIFITNSGTAKVFDFGISRAVKTKLEARGDETCFEPKSFTALTPTYASPEMIDGEIPNVRDDIYALAVVTYEILAGKHPFDRLPATEARDQRLKPERIKGLNSRQWHTLQMALSFSRSERIESVEAFRSGMFNRISSKQIYRRTILGAFFIAVAAFQTVGIIVSPSSDRPPQILEQSQSDENMSEKTLSAPPITVR